jgi:hypothetical protein
MPVCSHIHIYIYIYIYIYNMRTFFFLRVEGSTRQVRVLLYFTFSFFLGPGPCQIALTKKASIRQHTSAYVSIRQHTSAYVSIRQHRTWVVTVPDSAHEEGARRCDVLRHALIHTPSLFDIHRQYIYTHTNTHTHTYIYM